MFRKIVYSVTLVNILFQVVYSTIGKYTASDVGILAYIFYIFRPEYLLISGLAAILLLLSAIVLTVEDIFRTNKKGIVYNIAAMLLNIEFIVYYFNFLSRQ